MSHYLFNTKVIVAKLAYTDETYGRECTKSDINMSPKTMNSRNVHQNGAGIDEIHDKPTHNALCASD